LYNVNNKPDGLERVGRRRMPFDLDKIGQLLKATRVEKGLTFEDVRRALCVRKSTIEAIESGDWRHLPHDIYVKGYVTQYASFLKVLDLVKPELTPKEPPAAARKERRDPPAPQEGAPLHRRDLRKRIVGVAVMAGILIAFLIFLNVQRPGRVARPPYWTPQHNQQAAATDQTTRPDDRREEKPPDGTVESNYQTVAVANQSENAYDRREEKVVLDSKKLMIACQERTWLMVVIDGSERKEFMLNPEEVIMLSAKESFDVLIGNAGGVKLFYNGKDIDFTGKSGEVKRVNLP
jgi:transcriptional regulator with XRE-family HTH domain